MKRYDIAVIGAGSDATEGEPSVRAVWGSRVEPGRLPTSKPTIATATRILQRSAPCMDAHLADCWSSL